MPALPAKAAKDSDESAQQLPLDTDELDDVLALGAATAAAMQPVVDAPNVSKQRSKFGKLLSSIGNNKATLRNDNHDDEPVSGINF